jgi:hypothetical protein
MVLLLVGILFGMALGFDPTILLSAFTTPALDWSASRSNFAGCCSRPAWNRCLLRGAPAARSGTSPPALPRRSTSWRSRCPAVHPCPGADVVGRGCLAHLRYRFLDGSSDAAADRRGARAQPWAGVWQQRCCARKRSRPGVSQVGSEYATLAVTLSRCRLGCASRPPLMVLGVVLPLIAVISSMQ